VVLPEPQARRREHCRPRGVLEGRRGDALSVAATWGTTPSERALAYPCDAFVARLDGELWRGVTVRAGARIVFRWLCQLRAAPYSYDWIDNLGRTSPRTLTPGLEQLAVGQRAMSIFELVAFEPDRHVTFRTRRFATSLFPAVAVTYLLVPAAPDETRLLAKLALEVRPGPLGRAALTLLAWGDLVMMRKQLLTLRDLAETYSASGSG
jgi:hypothetical protein